ncbi:hypothetical protein FHS16_005756 [Paenibacillus endophyticus]|uniref:Uncharacterized protein n=1 Tax=Paenibacillus endophyticus TaxID=1294268 RepID=A0A7W5GDN7_9BACL|nr:hypothetical protein [Paenibacillus endophyticus]
MIMDFFINREEIKYVDIDMITCSKLLMVK